MCVTILILLDSKGKDISSVHLIKKELQIEPQNLLVVINDITSGSGIFPEIKLSIQN